MKKLLKIFLSIFLLALFAGCKDKEPENVTPILPVTTPPAKTTIVYVVRHAEKGTNSPTDPDLSTAGQARAQALKDSLAGKNLAAVYSTNYKRTIQTATPSAQAKNLTIQSYDAGNLNALATKVLNEQAGKTVLIVGHSNTVLETIEAFNATRPVSSISDSEYNYLFRVVLEENKPPKVEVKRYGN